MGQGCAGGFLVQVDLATGIFGDSSVGEVGAGPCRKQLPGTGKVLEETGLFGDSSVGEVLSSSMLSKSKVVNSGGDRNTDTL